MEEEKKVKKEKNLNRVLIFMICIVLILVFVIVLQNRMTQNKKEQNAKELFGEETCTALMHLATKDLVLHTCQLCGKEFEDSSMRVNLCTDCANEINRCEFCGKKKVEDKNS